MNSRFLKILKEDNIFLWDPVSQSQKALLFRRPVKTFCVKDTCTLKELEQVFSDMEQWRLKGFYLAGWISYELGYLLMERLSSHLSRHCPHTPLLWFGAFHEPVELDLNDHNTSQDVITLPHNMWIELDTDKEKFISAIEKIHSYIRSGDTYQINYTIRGKIQFNDHVEKLYLALRRRQQVRYAAFIRTSGEQTVLSLSPELFFQIEDGRIWSMPMKGTAPRGKNQGEDDRIMKQLACDEKNRAENVMIVDLLRNDMGKICKIGTVKVPELFRVEKYDTLFQMISRIEGCLREGVGLFQIIRALFPCGSITGAPKKRSMEIISEIENSPRGIYTGAIGFMNPKGDAIFNVAIRTLIFDGCTGELGIGAGITIGSDPEGEFEETLLKAKFLTDDIRFPL